MKRNTLNFVLDIVSLLNLLFLMVSGYVMTYTLPPREGSNVYRSLWGMDRHDWGDWHFWAAVLFVVLMVLHVALHWEWVCLTVGRMFRRGGGSPAARNVYGGAFFLAIAAILVGFVWWAEAEVVEEVRGGGGYRGGRGQSAAVIEDAGEPGEAHEGGRQGGGSGSWIRGATTLAEIEETTGVSCAEICLALGLPLDTPADTSLSSLRDKSGMSMSQMRGVIEKLQRD